MVKLHTVIIVGLFSIVGFGKSAAAVNLDCVNPGGEYKTVMSGDDSNGYNLANVERCFELFEASGRFGSSGCRIERAGSCECHSSTQGFVWNYGSTFSEAYEQLKVDTDDFYDVEAGRYEGGLYIGYRCW